MGYLVGGKPWNDEEDQELKNAFVGNVEVAEIANIHQRTTGAIRSRLQKLGLMDENGNKVQYKTLP